MFLLKNRNNCADFEHIHRPRTKYDGRLYFQFVSSHPERGRVPHLHPIILPLVPCPFWRGTPVIGLRSLSVGYPSPRWGVTQVPPPQSGQDGVPPSQVTMGYPVARMGYPCLGLGYPILARGYPIVTPWPDQDEDTPPGQDGVPPPPRAGYA